MERFFKRAFVILMALHIVVLSAILWRGYHGVYKQRDTTPDSRLYIIEEGASLVSVVTGLHERGLAPEPIFVRIALAFEGRGLVMKRGTYRLPERGSTHDFLTLFDAGKVMLKRVTIPEGLDMWQTATLLGETEWGDEAAFTKAIADPSPIKSFDPDADNLEGYLFPETYFFPEEAQPEEIVATMVQHFLDRTQSLREQLPISNYTPRQWLAMASLIQEESSVLAEGPLISGVFTNRLEQNMRLECDPTIIYSLKLAGIYRGKIYRSDIRRPHPYNTYVVKGLPPGPIASPGLKALEAALNPADVPYIFFVAKPDGTHHFSETYEEHERAIRRYLRR